MTSGNGVAPGPGRAKAARAEVNFRREPWCRRHRHLPVKVQHAALTRRIQGHFNYFGVSGNSRSLLLLVEEAKRAKRVWYKWLRRRSQQAHLNWEKFGELLKRFPLPRPRITVRIWGT